MRSERPSANLSFTESNIDSGVWLHRLGWPSPRHFPSLFRPHNQPFLSIQPIDTLRIHAPAFPPQQPGQQPIAVAHMHHANSRNRCRNTSSNTLSALIPQCPDRQLYDPRPVPLAASIDPLGPARQLPARTRPRSFFETISCRICRVTTLGHRPSSPVPDSCPSLPLVSSGQFLVFGFWVNLATHSRTERQRFHRSSVFRAVCFPDVRR